MPNSVHDLIIRRPYPINLPLNLSFTYRSIYNNFFSDSIKWGVYSNTVSRRKPLGTGRTIQVTLFKTASNDSIPHKWITPMKYTVGGLVAAITYSGPEHPHNLGDLKPTEWAPWNCRWASTAKHMTTRDYSNINFSVETDAAQPCCFSCVSFFRSHFRLFLQIHKIHQVLILIIWLCTRHKIILQLWEIDQDHMVAFKRGPRNYIL